MKRHAVATIDSVKLAREMTYLIKGNNIDKVNENIEKLLDDLEHSSKGVESNKIEADRRKEAEEMYQGDQFKKAFKALLLRNSLSAEVGEELRTFESSNNASLSLPNNELLEFVRITEQKKQNTNESVNGSFLETVGNKVHTKNLTHLNIR